MDKIKLDYSLESPQERIELVKKILNNSSQEKLSTKFLDSLSDYIIFAMDKEERKNKKILTDNRLYTINKRETSFEGLAGKLENGEDGIYNMLETNKNALLSPKDTITPEDIEKYPELKVLREAIAQVEEQLKTATGRAKFILKKQLIELRQDQYVIKNSFKQRMAANVTFSPEHPHLLSQDITVNKDGEIEDKNIISFFNPTHISALLCNYSKLKQESWGAFHGEMFYIMESLDAIAAKALADYPMYEDIVTYKIDGRSNEEIQELLLRDYQTKHSSEYISSLWRNKIPKLIADAAIDDFLLWYYTEVERGDWKKCSRCGQIKLAHKRFFSRNGAHWYSICKDCRSKKYKEGKKK